MSFSVMTGDLQARPKVRLLTNLPQGRYDVAIDMHLIPCHSKKLGSDLRGPAKEESPAIAYSRITEIGRVTPDGGARRRSHRKLSKKKRVRKESNGDKKAKKADSIHAFATNAPWMDAI